MKLRLRCRLLGCEAEKSGNCFCDHCGTYYMEDTWIGTTSLQYFIWKVPRVFKRLRIARCEQCGERIPPFTAYNDDFCSAECYSNWLPF